MTPAIAPAKQPPDAPPQRRTAIRVENVTKSYGDVSALRGVSLEVKTGEMFALLGPNGAGKTTLFSILATLRKLSSGSASVLGFDVTRERTAIRRNIGIVFQQPALDDRLSTRDNLEIMGLLYGLTRAQVKRNVEAVMDTLELHEFAKRPPRKLSGGQKRRLELARALIADPKVLFLDEATLGLDVDARRTFWHTVRKMADEGRTIFFTTHYMEEAEVADRIALINEGNIIALDTPRNLKAGIGGGVIRLQTEDNLEAEHWLRERGYAPEASGVDLLLVVPDAAAVLPELLKEMPGKVLRAEIRDPSLEDVFLTLTGKGLETGAPAFAKGGPA